MGIIESISPESHENLLAISLLRNGVLSRKELKQRIMKGRGSMLVLGLRGLLPAVRRHRTIFPTAWQVYP